MRVRWGGGRWKDAVPLAASERTTNPQITETLPTHIYMCVCVYVCGDYCSDFFLFPIPVSSLQYEFTLKYVKLCNNNNNNNKYQMM
jgi:hypothetical protein